MYEFIKIAITKKIRIMKQLLNKTKSILILVLALSFIGCEEDDGILPQIEAGFTHTISENTNTVTFINVSTNATSYSWDFGDETTSNEVNPVKVYPNGSYTIVLTASNSAGASDTFTDTITFLDAEIPLITLIGDAIINVTLGNTFTDPGATALDDVDGDITADIVVGGDTVDTAVEGSYVITYDVTDAQGNDAIQVTRTVNVAAIACTAETEGSLSASDLNITFMTDPSSSIISDGGTFSWVDNPDLENTVNATCKVAQITKEGINPWDNTQIDLDAKLDFNTNTGLKIKVWSPLPNTEVRIKLEEIGNSSNNVEQFLTTSVANGWEELTFPFTSAESNRFNKIVMFFDLNANNTDTYYFDDLMLYGTGSGGGCVPETTESIASSNLNITFQTNTPAVITDNTTFTWVDNPDANGANTSCKVGQVIRANNSPYDNIQMDLTDKFDFTTSDGFKMKVWSPVANTPVLLKLEEIGNSANAVETQAITSVTNGWEELTFNFAATATPQFNKMVIFFNFNVADASTYYFDDLKLYGSGGTSSGTFDLTQTIDFESTGFGANWTWNVFENDSNQPLEFVGNPAASGINTSSTVAKITALQTGAPWVGTETAHGQMGITWDLSSSNAIIKIMVYKTVISDVGIKLVNPAGGAQSEIKVANTLINQWEELTFDFSSRIGNGLDGSTNIDQIVVFPDFDLGGRTSDNVVYFDNITFN